MASCDPVTVPPFRPPSRLSNSKNSCGGGSARSFHRSQAPQTAVRTTVCLQRPTGSGLPSAHRSLPALGFSAPAAGFPIRASRPSIWASRPSIRASSFPIPVARSHASEVGYHYRREQIPCSGSHILYSGEHIPCSGSHIPCLSGQLPHCRSHNSFHSACLSTQPNP